MGSDGNIDILLKRARSEYEREKQRLSDDLEALEEHYGRVIYGLQWAAEQRNGAPIENQKSSAEVAIGAVNRQFTRKDLETQLVNSGSKLSKSAITNQIDDLVRRRLIRVAIQGKGRRATVYEKVASS